MAIIDQLSDQWAGVLREHAVQVAGPHDEMLELKAVLAGPGYTKPRTNLLLRRVLGCWEVFVDDDFHYLGDDERRRRLFCGDRVNQWRALTPPEPVEGDVHRALLCALEWLDSPIRAKVALPAPVQPQTASPLDPQLARAGRLLSRRDLEQLAVEPTAAQSEAIRRIAEIATRTVAPACAVVFGPAGCGKTATAATAAVALMDRSLIREVLQLSGATIASGAIFPQQRDERLRQILELAHARRGALVVLEQFDLVARHSETAACLIADYVDRGIRLVGIARSEFTPIDLEHCDVLARRAEPVVLDAPQPAEEREIVLRRLQTHPLANRVEVAPEVVPAVLLLARLRPGANPGAALSLLDAGLARAAWSSAPLLGPDDLYDLVPNDQDDD
jgi:hypothetical protein